MDLKIQKNIEKEFLKDLRKFTYNSMLSWGMCCS